MIEVTIRQAKKILAETLKENKPTLLVGPPGCGKSQALEQAADEAGMDYIVETVVCQDEMDANGLMMADAKNKVARWLPFEKQKMLSEIVDPAVLHLEDFGQARPAVQAAYMPTLLSRSHGQHQLSDEVRVVGSTNGREHRAGVTGILEPMKDRFLILHIKPNLKEWIEDVAIPRGFHPSITSFLRLRPECFYRFEPSAEITNTPTARGWEDVSAYVGMGLDQPEQLPVFAGRVGEGAAVEFTGHLRVYQEVPLFDEIVLNPSGTAVPEAPAANYAVAGMVAHHVTKKNLGRAIQYIQRLQPEFGVLAIRDMVRRDKNLINTVEWTAFTATDLGKLCLGED